MKVWDWQIACDHLNLVKIITHILPGSDDLYVILYSQLTVYNFIVDLFL